MTPAQAFLAGIKAGREEAAKEADKWNAINQSSSFAHEAVREITTAIRALPDPSPEQVEAALEAAEKMLEERS